MSRTIAIIPARLGSTRFPGKVLARETGYPMLWHVCQRASEARSIQEVVVATDEQRVVDAMEELGVRALLTDAAHTNGTSRIAQACRELGLADDDVVVNVQGDEPELEPGLIDGVVGALRESGCEMATVASPFADDEDPDDPNIVKVVTDSLGRAVYFSRARIPCDRESSGQVRWLKHVGLYAYRRDFLETYVKLTPTPLEQAERLEQLRAIEHGYRIGVVVLETSHHGVDTPEQYRAFVARWRSAHPG